MIKTITVHPYAKPTLHACAYRCDADGHDNSNGTYLFVEAAFLAKAEYDAYMDDLDAWQSDRDYWYERLMDEQQQANWNAEYDLSVKKAAFSGSGGSGRSRSASIPTASSNYNTFLNGLKENVRIQVISGKSKTAIYAMINRQINEFLSNDFITSAEAKQMRTVAQSYYQTQYAKRSS